MNIYEISMVGSPLKGKKGKKEVGMGNYAHTHLQNSAPTLTLMESRLMIQAGTSEEAFDLV